MLDFVKKDTFPHGIHPPESKDDTSGLAIRQFPLAPVLMIPFSQHIGNPAKPVVREKQEVARGQVLAEADGFVSVSQHAPASGVVRRIGLMPSITGKMVDLFAGLRALGNDPWRYSRTQAPTLVFDKVQFSGA